MVNDNIRTALPGGLAGTVPLTGGSSVTLTAPEYQYEPATRTAPASYWQLMFWDVNATLITTETATFTAPTAGGAFEGTAWYLPISVVGACGGGTSQVTTWAFSLTNYEVLPGTPIGSVTPVTSPPAWTSPGTAVAVRDRLLQTVHNAPWPAEPLPGVAALRLAVYARAKTNA